MIDFRYHLVSIVAVFLALAIGIVLGTTALNGPITSRLRSLETSLRSEADSLRTQKGELQQQVNSDQAFAQLATPLVVAHLLDGQSVALVTAPGAQQQAISGVTAAVQLAGGTVTGQVALQQQFFDTSATNENKLIALAQQLALPQSAGTVQGAQQSASPQLTGQLQAASLLAAAIVTKDGPGLLASQSHAILDGFAQDGFLQVSKPAMTPATLAVVIIPATPPSAGDSDPANVALISMTQILTGACKGAVLAGSYPGSGAGSAIDELASGNTGIEVSSVDNANTATGQIFVVQALSKLLSGHKPASYGIATGSAPSPAPTPSASLSPVP
jgi:Copper transport outer membrane protein, MctB